MSNSALMLRPRSIEAAMVTAMDAVESTAAYNGATNYSSGSEVHSDVTHRVYRSAIDGNVGNAPTDPLNVPSKWIDVRPTNDWALWDAMKSTRTTRAGSLSWTIEPGKPVDCLGLARLLGSTVQVVVTDGTTEYYNRTIDLTSTEGIIDWYSWFFSERVQEDTQFLDDLPGTVAEPVITTTIIASDGDAGVGVCQAGRQLDIGSTAVGARLGFVSYSEYTEDGFGGTEVTARGYSFWEEVQLFLSSDRIKYVRSQVLQYRDTPVFFALAGDFTVMTAFGFAKSLDIEIPYPTYSLASLRVDETLETS